MPHDSGMGIVFFQAEQQGIEGTTLRLRARVGRGARRGETPFVADADAVAVEPLGMSPLLMERTAGMDRAVARDVIVIADVGKAAGQVVAPAVFQRVGTVAAGGAAMQHNQVDEPVVLILAAREDGHAHRV